MRERIASFLSAIPEVLEARKRQLKIGVPVLLLLLAGYIGYRIIFGPADDIDESGALRVKVEQISRSKVTPSIVSTGSIEPYEKAEIISKTQGRIERILVDQGQAVTAGQLLVQIERLPLELELQQLSSQHRAARAEFDLTRERYNNARRDIDVRWEQIKRQRTAVRRAKAILDRTEATFKGQTLLYKEGGLSTEQYRIARTDLISREAEYRTALRDLKIAKVGFRDKDIKKRGLAVPENEDKKYRVLRDINTAVQKSEMEVARARAAAAASSMANIRRLLNETDIRSPIDGVIAVRNKSPGEEVSGLGSATSSAALLTIVDIDRVYAAVSVREGDSRQVRVGQELRFTVDVFGGAKYTAEVKLIAPVVDPKTHTISVKAILDNPGRELKPGMFLRGEIITGEPEDVFLVPVKALQSLEGGKARIWLVRENRAFPVEVEPGRRHGEKQAVEGPLKAGDVLVLNKLTLLREGRRLAPEKSADEKPAI